MTTPEQPSLAAQAIENLGIPETTGQQPEPNTFEEEVKAMRSMRKKFDSLPTPAAKRRVLNYLHGYLRETLPPLPEDLGF